MGIMSSREPLLVINASNQARAGRIRLLAVTSENRLPSHPDLPSMSETVKGVAGVSWFGVLARPKLAAPLAERLEAEILRAIAQPDVQARLGETGMNITALRSRQFLAFIESDIRKWVPVLRAAGLDKAP
ncbi:MAG: hypothetical protein EXR33_07570 [Betaproteobacteria bacterium]|nr:hypothetical protein [Betaproteobacteria bacterium]